MRLHRGTRVQVRNAFDEVVTMVALGEPEAGQDFPVLWVCSEDEYLASDEPDGIAWPLDAVQTMEPA